MRKSLALLSSAAALLLAACNAETFNVYSQPVEQPANPGSAKLLPETYRAADTLVNSAILPLDMNAPLLVSSVVDIDSVDQTSTLGRAISEQLTSRFAQLGYAVNEIRLRDSLAIRPGEGELMLSRDLAYLAGRQDAQAILTGTYTVGSDNVFVNLRLLRAGDGRIISSTDFRLPIDDDLYAMLPAKADRGWVLVR